MTTCGLRAQYCEGCKLGYELIEGRHAHRSPSSVIWPCVATSIAAANAAVLAKEAENAALRKLIQQAEWHGEPSVWPDQTFPGCPWCDLGKPDLGHQETCPAAKAMGWKALL